MNRTELAVTQFKQNQYLAWIEAERQRIQEPLKRLDKHFFSLGSGIRNNGIRNLAFCLLGPWKILFPSIFKPEKFIYYEDFSDRLTGTGIALGGGDALQIINDLSTVRIFNYRGLPFYPDDLSLHIERYDENKMGEIDINTGKVNLNPRELYAISVVRAYRK